MIHPEGWSQKLLDLSIHEGISTHIQKKEFFRSLQVQLLFTKPFWTNVQKITRRYELQMFLLEFTDSALLPNMPTELNVKLVLEDD